MDQGRDWADAAWALRQLVLERGESVASNPSMVKAYLSDRAPSSQAATNVLVQTVNSGVAEDIAKSPAGIPVLAQSFIGRLTGPMCLAEPAALWAIQTWTWALGCRAASSASCVADPAGPGAVLDQGRVNNLEPTQDWPSRPFGAPESGAPVSMQARWALILSLMGITLQVLVSALPVPLLAWLASSNQRETVSLPDWVVWIGIALLVVCIVAISLELAAVVLGAAAIRLARRAPIRNRSQALGGILVGAMGLVPPCLLVLSLAYAVLRFWLE